MAQTGASRDPDILLKGGLIVDGSGGAPYTANLLIRAGRVSRISPRALRTTGVVIDCGGMVVAPGFIDAHSHLDWHIPVKGRDDLKLPFLAQGITTVVTGNCGLSAAGFREGSRVEGASFVDARRRGTGGAAQSAFGGAMGNGGRLFCPAGIIREQPEYRPPRRPRLDARFHPGLRLVAPAPLRDHGDALAPRARDGPGCPSASPLGCSTSPARLRGPRRSVEVARLVKKKGKILAVHPRAFAPYRRGHSLNALKEVIDIARATGVRLQISHFFFAGARAGRTAEAALAAIDSALKEGLDIKFDLAPSSCAASVIGVVLPAWFLARGSAGYGEASSLRRLKRELRVAERRAGFGPADIQVTNTIDPELAEHNGRFLQDIARLRRMGTADALHRPFAPKRRPGKGPPPSRHDRQDRGGPHAAPRRPVHDRRVDRASPAYRTRRRTAPSRGCCSLRGIVTCFRWRKR